MNYKLLKLEKLADFLRTITQGKKLVVPARDEGVVLFKEFDESFSLALDVNPVNSIKDWLLPQSEPIFRFSTEGGRIRIKPEPPAEDVLFFGARPCDLAAVKRLDLVFGEGLFQDSYYINRRNRTLMVGLACETPGQWCFCTVFGIAPGSKDGADIMAYPVSGKLLLEAVTANGAAAMEAANAFLEDASNVEEVIKSYAEKEVPLGSRFRADGLAEQLSGMFDHPIWSDISRTCLSCGICTYTCPTCYCFLLSDETIGKEGVRFRCWDSCMYASYTLMAGGANPRPTAVERVRQRFMHKLCYFNKQHGVYLCVGCGRCVERCPVGINVIRFLDELKVVVS